MFVGWFVLSLVGVFVSVFVCYFASGHQLQWLQAGGGREWEIGMRHYEHFLPCDAMRCTVFVIVILSVCLSACLSVCPSITLVDCVHMVRPKIMISSPYGSPIILVSGDITFIPKFEGGYPERGR